MSRKRGLGELWRATDDLDTDSDDEHKATPKYRKRTTSTPEPEHNPQKQETSKSCDFYTESRLVRPFPVSYEAKNNDIKPEVGSRSDATAPSNESFSDQHDACAAIPGVIEQDGVTVALEDLELWRTFYRCGTEMIINRPGRRMFPSVVLTIRGLNPHADYKMAMEVVPADDKRYKYVNSRWTVVGKADPEITNPPFVHADSPSRGRFWMQTKISFAKVKITNNRESGEGNILIHSMHKYMARLTVLRLSDVERRVDQRLTFSLPLTTFVAVTAYQSENITQMKIRNNPFAKAFRDGDLPGLTQDGSSTFNRRHLSENETSRLFGSSLHRRGLDRRHISSTSLSTPNGLFPSLPNYLLNMPLPVPSPLQSFPFASPDSYYTGIKPPGLIVLPPVMGPANTMMDRNEATYRWLNACAEAHARSSGIHMTSRLLPDVPPPPPCFGYQDDQPETCKVSRRESPKEERGSQSPIKTESSP